MKNLFICAAIIAVSLSLMACGDASSAETPLKQYASIKANGQSAMQLEATLQAALAEAKFMKSDSSPINLVVEAVWSENKDFMTLCVKSEPINSEAKQDDYMMLGGCVNVSQKDAGIPNAIGVALLPKAGPKMAKLLLNQATGKETPKETVTATEPVTTSANEKKNTNTKPAKK